MKRKTGKDTKEKGEEIGSKEKKDDKKTKCSNPSKEKET